MKIYCFNIFVFYLYIFIFSFIHIYEYIKLHIIIYSLKIYFHSASFDNAIFGTCRADWNCDFRTYRIEALKVVLKISVSTRSTVTSNQIFKRVAMKNNMDYSKQNTTDSTSMNTALISLGQQTSHSLQSLCFVPSNAMYYYMFEMKIWSFSQIINKNFEA